MMDLSLGSIEETFKAFLSSSKVNHFLLYIPVCGIEQSASDPSQLEVALLVDFLDGCFHTNFMKAVRSEGFEVVTPFAQVSRYYGLCVLLSRKLNVSPAQHFIQKTFESLYAAGVFWNDTDKAVVAWDDINSQSPHLLLCSKEEIVVKANFSATDLQEQYELLKVIESTFAKLKAINDGFYDTRKRTICRGPVPHVRCTFSHWFNERLYIDDDKHFSPQQVHKNAVVALPYNFLEDTDEVISGDNKSGNRKNINSARKEKKRQYHKRLRDRKKAEVKDPRTETVEEQDSDTNTPLDTPCVETTTKLAVTFAPELQRPTRNVSEKLEHKAAKTDMTAWVVKIILILLWVQLCVLWKGMLIIEYLVVFWVGYFVGMQFSG
ncbi:hypothetical protein FJTKL_06239 [Diaporthe vaccinii]|uniref:Uncharacterized protein n=1 Tax=Diaporthe vaccinii TaxID=105482 RepID=A0ABR4DQL3_9PEZI